MIRAETGVNSKRVVVVGAGIIGASIAYHLVERGADVTLLDAAEPGSGASGVSFAWINGRDKNPRHYHDLNRRSLDMWERFSRRLGGDIGLTWSGELRWVTAGGRAAEFRERVSTLQTWGYPIQLLDATTARRLEPALHFGEIVSASYTQIDGHVEPKKVIDACIDYLCGQGAVVRWPCRVTAMDMDDEHSERVRISVVDTDCGRFAADSVVLAAGADTPALAALAGLTVPLSHSFGATVVTVPTQPILQSVGVVHTPREADLQTNLRQLQNGSVMIHGGSHGGPTDGSMGRTDSEVEKVISAAAHYFPELNGLPIEEVRRGRRPLPDDGLPIIGYAKDVPNLYLAAMHSGVTLAALVGEYAAMEILDDCRIDTLAPYRLERFGDRRVG